MSTAGASLDRAVIRLQGGDRVSFLQGLITQDVESLAGGAGAFAALLTPQGKILFDFFVVNTGEHFLIDCHRDSSGALLKRLTLYKLRADVSMTIDDSLSVAVSQEEVNGAIAAYADPRLAGLDWRAIVETGDMPVAENYDAKRIALGVPQAGDDFGGDAMFLLDVNYDALGGVDYKKGCFVGQEVTSRMKRKGEVRRRTLIAEHDGPPLEPGVSITAGESTLGEVFTGSTGCALALIRVDRWRRAQEEGATLECGGRELRLVVPDYLEQR